MRKLLILSFLLLSIIASSCNVMVFPEEPEPEPTSCPEIYQPICCEGKTYANDCFASIDGFEDCGLGECEENCVPDPERACTREYDPFCCDGIGPCIGLPFSTIEVTPLDTPEGLRTVI